MKTFDANYRLLEEMYQDEYYPDFLVDKVKTELQKVIALLEEGETDTKSVQEKLDESVCAINALQEEFEEHDSEIETVARDCIGETVTYILDWFDIPIVKDEAAVWGRNFDHDDLAVGNVCFFCFSSADVQVTFCSDNAFGQFNLTGRTNQFARSAASQVAGQSDRSVEPQASGVGSGKLYLRFGAEWTQDADICLRFFRTNNGYLLVACKLTFDGKLFFNGELCVCAEQSSEVLSGQVYVSCGSFYWKSIAHGFYILLK